MDRATITHLVEESLGELRSFHPSVGSGTVLYGPDGICDSIALIQLIAQLERKILREHGIKISLVSPQAFARERSPFRTVESLVAFVVELLGKDG